MDQIPQIPLEQIDEWGEHPVTQALKAAVRRLWCRRVSEALGAKNWEEFVESRGALRILEHCYRVETGIEDLDREINNLIDAKLLHLQEPLLLAIFDSDQRNSEATVEAVRSAEEAQREQNH